MSVAVLATVQLLAGPPRNLAQKQLLVTVIADEKGPVRNLTAADFVLVEDRATREVTGAAPAVGPLSIALLVDISQPPQSAQIPMITRDLRQSLTTFVKTIQAAAPDAQISYGEFAGAAVTRVPFTGRTAELEQALSKVYPDTRTDAVMLEALIDAGGRLGQTPPPRRAVVSLDFNSPETSRESAQKPAVEAVEKTGATVWCVTVGSAGSRNSRETVLNALTQRTGGQRQTIVDTTGLEARLTGIAHSLLSQYEITFNRPDNVTSVKDTQITTKQGHKALKTVWMR
jgi:hypothetical protein